MFFTRIAADPSGAARMGLNGSRAVRDFVCRLFGGGLPEDGFPRDLLYSGGRTCRLVVYSLNTRTNSDPAFSAC